MEQSLAPFVSTIQKYDTDLTFLAARLAESFPLPLQSGRLSSDVGNPHQQRKPRKPRRSTAATGPVELLQRLAALETKVAALKLDSADLKTKNQVREDKSDRLPVRPLPLILTSFPARKDFAQKCSASVAHNAALMERIRDEADCGDEDDETAGSVDKFADFAQRYPGPKG
ncbi:hypothetical protein HKX48_006036 [Thoreauomyces humboldtii]|nr:hypothetical protein HKX48_006036 [Thoreauomyces humboldtii]